MKTNKIFVIVLIILAFSFLTSSVYSAASWFSESKTKNSLSLSTVKCRICETYDEGKKVMPGEYTEKRVIIQNTGECDAFIRVGLLYEWGHYDNDNEFVPEVFSSENIIPDLNRDDWIFDDDYFYYLYSVPPGEYTSEIMYGFTLDKSSDNFYAGKTGRIKVVAEIIPASLSSYDYWTSSLFRENSEFVSFGKIETGSSVVFENPSEGFSFSDDENGNLFLNYKDMVPGECYGQEIEISNEFSRSVEIFLWSEADPDVAGALNLDLISKYSELTVTDDSGNTVYKGPVYYDSDTGKINVSLGYFEANSKKKLYLNLLIFPEIGNEFKKLQSSVIWGFKALGKETIINPPGGDNIMFSVTVMCVSGIGLIIMTVIKRKYCKD